MVEANALLSGFLGQVVAEESGRARLTGSRGAYDLADPEISVSTLV